MGGLFGSGYESVGDLLATLDACQGSNEGRQGPLTEMVMVGTAQYSPDTHSDTCWLNETSLYRCKSSIVYQWHHHYLLK